MKTVDSLLIKADYQSIAQQSHCLLEERLVYRYIEAWDSALNDFCKITGASRIKLQAVFDKFSDSFFLKISNGNVVHKYPLTVSGINEFKIENNDWLEDVAAWNDITVDDFDNLIDDLKYVKGIDANDTFVSLGDPHVGLADK